MNKQKEVELFLSKKLSKDIVKKVVKFDSNYSLLSLYTDTTVVKYPEIVLRGRFVSQNNRFIGEEFLLNYRSSNNLLEFKFGISRFYDEDALLMSCHGELKEDTTNSIPLPKPMQIETKLSIAITHRRSTRKYQRKTMSLQELSTILYYADGVSGEMRINILEKSETKKLRNAPSAGALYPIDLYIVVLNVQGLQKGIYQYYPYSNSLNFISKILSDDIRKFAEFGDVEVLKASFMIVYVYNLYINSIKYGDSAVAYALIETGEIAQNVQLVSTGIGYASCDIGGYNKINIEKALQLDGFSQHVIHLTVIGKGDDD